jgi:hypothetical protein
MSYNDVLNKLLLNLDTDAVECLIELWMQGQEIDFIRKGNMQYKITNGCVPNIMFYPSKHKLMIQVDGKNYIQTASADALIGAIKGTLPFRKEKA